MNQGAEASEQSSRSGGGVRDNSLSDDDGADERMSDRRDGKMKSALECEGATTAVVGTKSGLQKAVSHLELDRILGETAHRVSRLEAKVLPRDTGNRAGDEEESIPESLAPGAGGAFARLVVVKELQPVPEHAPEDARHLLELALDHQQVFSLPGRWFGFLNRICVSLRFFRHVSRNV